MQQPHPKTLVPPLIHEEVTVKDRIGARSRQSFGLVAISLFLLALTPAPAVAAWTVGRPIITYFAGPGGGPATPITEAVAAELAQGGWNLVPACSVEGLDMAQAHGLRAMWTGSQDDQTVARIRNHPALYGYHVADEPLPERFPELAETVSRLRKADPNHVAYINLFPTFGVEGIVEYREYLRQYMTLVKPDLLSYDFYQFWNGFDMRDYFKNLAIISHTAKQAGIPFLNVVQTCSFTTGARNPTGNELRYLYYTTLAYGAAGVSDFVYEYKGPGFTGGMSVDGKPTALYHAAKAIHPALEAIATQVQPMTHIGAYHLGDLPPGYNTTDGSSPQRLPDGSPFTLSGVATTTYQLDTPVKGALLGLYGSGKQLSEATCALVVNLNYSGALNTRMTGPDDLSVFDPTTGKWIAQGRKWADVDLEPGGGVLVKRTSTVGKSTGGGGE